MKRKTMNQRADSGPTMRSQQNSRKRLKRRRDSRATRVQQARRVNDTPIARTTSSNPATGMEHEPCQPRVALGTLAG